MKIDLTACRQKYVFLWTTVQRINFCGDEIAIGGSRPYRQCAYLKLHLTVSKIYWIWCLARRIQFRTRVYLDYCRWNKTGNKIPAPQGVHLSSTFSATLMHLDGYCHTESCVAFTHDGRGSCQHYVDKLQATFLYSVLPMLIKWPRTEQAIDSVTPFSNAPRPCLLNMFYSPGTCNFIHANW